MKLALLTSWIFVVTGDLDSEWNAFLLRYNRSYETFQEQSFRKSVFSDNLVHASSLNQPEIKGSAHFGVTKFMDLTPSEFADQYLLKQPRRWNSTGVVRNAEPFMNRSRNRSTGLSGVPNDFRWNNQGVVTPVYNQGSCGSCWAFSATEAVESAWAISGHGLTELSVQQIVDCDEYDHGCGGGWPAQALAYTMDHGLEPWTTYPYQGSQQSCKYQPSSVKATISKWVQVSSGATGEANMAAQSYSMGPLSVFVDATKWQYYQYGIILASQNCGYSHNHCVLLTGWGYSTTNVPYWYVRNSWGTSWGEDGYVGLQYGFDVCGVADDVVVPVV